MRIVGIVLILIGLPLIGWFGYVELYYLGEVESGFEEQRIKSEEALISKIPTILMLPSKYLLKVI